MMPPLLLNGCCSLIRALVPHFAARWELRFPELELRIIQTVRSRAYQQELFAKGRTAVGPGVDSDHPLGRKVTWADGVTTLSNHQTQLKHLELAGHAVDGGLFRGGVYLEGIKREELKLYEPFREIAAEVGLVSGWTFPAGKTDPDHLQCDPSRCATQPPDIPSGGFSPGGSTP